MEIREIKDKNIWEDFLFGCKDRTFLQSFGWGEFQERMGNKIWRLGTYRDDKLISVTLVVKITARRGAFLLIQHGLGISEVLLNKLKEIAKKENCSFIRMAPLLARNEENKKMFQDLGFKEAPMHANAYEATWKLDITPSEDEILKNMRKTTRYLIRQAQKNNEIEISQSQKMEDVDFFDNLVREVAKTQHFVPFPAEYAKNEFLVLNKKNEISLFFGRYKGKIVAGALVVFWSNIGN